MRVISGFLYATAPPLARPLRPASQHALPAAGAIRLCGAAALCCAPPRPSRALSPQRSARVLAEIVRPWPACMCLATVVCSVRRSGQGPEAERLSGGARAQTCAAPARPAAAAWRRRTWRWTATRGACSACCTPSRRPAPTTRQCSCAALGTGSGLLPYSMLSLLYTITSAGANDAPMLVRGPGGRARGKEAACPVRRAAGHETWC